MSAEYISVADTAKAIRAALKGAFGATYPQVTFSVRSKSYSGGASIDVSWTDGPTAAQVERVAGKFAGATFDGMVDLKSYHESQFQGRRVHWGADFVFCTRHMSPARYVEAVETVRVQYGMETPAAKLLTYTQDGSPYLPAEHDPIVYAATNLRLSTAVNVYLSEHAIQPDGNWRKVAPSC